jgi:NAD(P)-dependent dehydrogenase (short-subunit alcohol dehydrogenase family)/acyl carrier protein
MPELVVLTSGAVDVSGSELVHPLKSMAVGIVTTLGMEAPGARCRMIDIGGSIDPEQLATELRCSPAPALVALRGSRRWVPAERALDLPSHDHAALREQGVYLITGGLSGIGLELARGLARTGLRPRLALLGRRVPDGEPPLPEPVAARVRMTVSEMEALGAVVRIESCDVADAAQLRRALDRVGVAFGPINGVVHSAGVPGDGVIQLRRPSDALRVWRPKVLGTLLLHEYLQTEHRPDFFVSCSSRAGTYGLIGSGDYAAANAFLDAHAATAWDRTRALSIGWPSWREVGMAARAADTASPEELSGEVVLDEVMDAATHWVLDEHRLGDLPLLPGTGQLELVVRAFRRQAGRAAIRLEDVIFLRPLVAETAVRVQVVASSGQGLDRFTVRSHQPVRGWTEHTTGRVRLVDPAQRHVDLAALEARIAGQVPPALPAEPEAGVVAFGPRWRNLGRQVRGQDEDLVELVLPDEFQADLREHPLHPALLDDATATAQRATGTSQLPFMYQALTVFDSLPARCWVHLGYRPDDRHGSVVDAELIGVDGRVIVAVEGFRMRPVDRERLPGGPRAQTGPPGGEPGAARHHPGVGDLSPETGVELFLRLLNTRTPPHVLVRPYEDAPPQQPASASRAAALPARPAASVPARAAGTDELKTTIRAFWTEATGIDGIGDDDDFFELGGDSLTAIQLMSQIRDSYGVELSIALLFEHPTVALLATAIRDEAGSS